MGALPNGRDRLVRKEREADTGGLPGAVRVRYYQEGEN